MADTKLSALTQVSIPDLLDLVYGVDVSDTTDGAGGSSRGYLLTRTLGLLNHVCQGRLTLTSGTPVTTADVTGATSVFFTPCRGNCISLYDGTRWRLYTFTELTLALGTLVNAQGYDVFCYDNAGTLTLEALEWANATVTMTIAAPCVVTWTAHGMLTGNSITFTNSGGALPTGVVANTQYWITKVDANTFKLSTSPINVAAGTFITTTGTQSGTHTGHQPQARQTALVLQDGVLCKTGALTRRYLGSFFTTSTTTTEDSYGGASQAGGKRFLWNMYNRVARPLAVIDVTNTWTYSTATWRAAGGVQANQVQAFIGVAEDPVRVNVLGAVSSSSTVFCGVGVGVDSTNTNSAKMEAGACLAAGIAQAIPAFYDGYVSAGYHFFQWLEIATTAGTTTWLGDNGLTFLQSGLQGAVQA